MDISMTFPRIREMAIYFCETLEEVTFTARSRLALIEVSVFGSCNKLGPVDVLARAEINGKVNVFEVVDHPDRSTRRRIHFPH
jgi:hypothetical protein